MKKINSFLVLVILLYGVAVHSALPAWEVTYVSNGKYQRWYSDRVSVTTGPNGVSACEFIDVSGQHVLVNGWVRVQATKDTRSSQTLYRRKK